MRLWETRLAHLPTLDGHRSWRPNDSFALTGRWAHLLAQAGAHIGGHGSLLITTSPWEQA